MSKEHAIEIIGHAGAAGFHPRNSRESIEKALELGVDRIEIDVLSTREDVLVLIHDNTILIDTVQQPVHLLTLEEILSAIPGALTLEGAVELAGGRVQLLLDIKGRHYVQPLIAEVARLAACGPVSVCSTHARVLKRLHAALPGIPMALSRGHSLTKIRNTRLRSFFGRVIAILQIAPIIVVGRWCGAREFTIQHHICRRPFVWAAHAAGFRVITWTVDDPADIRRVLSAGVDGITSNRPDLVAIEVRSRGL